MMSYEQFYLEQILPICKEIDELNAEKARRYAALNERYRRSLEQLLKQQDELRRQCSLSNQELERQILALKEDFSAEGVERKRQLNELQHKNRLELTYRLDMCEASVRSINAEARNAKVRLCDEMHGKVRRLCDLKGAQNRDFRRRCHEEGLQGRPEWSGLKRWIYRRFFAKKGGAV